MFDIHSNQDLDWFSRFFRLAMFWKIFYGILKIVTAIVLLKFVVIDPSGLFYQLMAHEIIEDPNDLFVKIASPLIAHLSVNSTTFAAAYLLFWGIVDDIFLSLNILKGRLWAFPVALTLIALFVPYEIFRFSHTHSLALVFFIAVDIVIFLIINKEYQKVKHRMLHN